MNETNALGARGEVARAYAGLCRAVAREPAAALYPDKLLNAVSRFNSDFRGRRQHDAHELLNTLLDGLHEDLNRVRGKKPWRRGAGASAMRRRSPGVKIDGRYFENRPEPAAARKLFLST